MLTKNECGSWRNYSLYLTAKSFELFTYIITIIFLIIPCSIGQLAEWITMILRPFAYFVHEIRRKIVKFVQTYLLKLMIHEDEDDGLIKETK